ncbi:MAG: hypothetical protein ABIO76_10415 [Ginsengibacter sp.]
MNCKFFRLLVLTILLLNFNRHSFAQSGSGPHQDTLFVAEDQGDTINTSEIAEDTAIIKTVFDIGIDSFQQWKSSRDFSYMTYLDSILRKETGLRSDTVSIDQGTGKKRKAVTAKENNSANFLNSLPLKIFFWAAAIFFIGFIIYKLFLTESFFAKRNIKITDEASDETPQGLSDYLKYNDLIYEAEAKSDYNLCTRYLYLQTLKKLADSDLISYCPDKTNDSYVKELLGKGYRHDFASLTLNYEYVWYGKFVITSAQYRELKEQFFSFNKKV